MCGGEVRVGLGTGGQWREDESFFVAVATSSMYAQCMQMRGRLCNLAGKVLEEVVGGVWQVQEGGGGEECLERDLVRRRARGACGTGVG